MLAKGDLAPAGADLMTLYWRPDGRVTTPSFLPFSASHASPSGVVPAAVATSIARTVDMKRDISAERRWNCGLVTALFLEGEGYFGSTNGRNIHARGPVFGDFRLPYPDVRG